MKTTKIVIGIFLGTVFMAGFVFTTAVPKVKFLAAPKAALADDDEEEDEEEDDEEDNDQEELQVGQAEATVDVSTSVSTTTLTDSDGDGLLDRDDPHPGIAEIYIVEDDDRDGIVDKFERDVQDGE